MAHPNEGARSFFTADHRACDAAWARLEAAADGGGPIRDSWEPFQRSMLRHFKMEEEVLFPAFEEATGMGGGGPTAVMRQEHAQMRALLEDMATAAAAGETTALLDQGDTLLMLVQQHNAKEEGMLYPMAEAHLGRAWGPIAARLAAIAGV